MHIQTPEDMEYAIHWMQCSLILHNMIIQFKRRLGKESTMPWAQREAADLSRDHNNMVMRVPTSSLGQLFCAELTGWLFDALGKPYIINGGVSYPELYLNY